MEIFPISFARPRLLFLMPNVPQLLVKRLRKVHRCRFIPPIKRMVVNVYGQSLLVRYDHIKTVWLGSNERGEILWHTQFLDFALVGITPRLCR